MSALTEAFDIFSRMTLENAVSLLRSSQKIPCYLIRESRTVGQIALSILFSRDQEIRLCHYRFAFNGQTWVNNDNGAIQDIVPIDLDKIRNPQTKNSLLQKINALLVQKSIPQNTIIRPTEAQRTKHALYAAWGNFTLQPTEENRARAKELFEAHHRDAITYEELKEEAVILPSGQLVSRDTLRRARAAGHEAYKNPFTAKPLSSEDATHRTSTIISRLSNALEKTS